MGATFDDLVVWGQTMGMTLNEGLDRRCVDGVWGMFANRPITEGEILASCPKSALIHPNPDAYPPGTSRSVMNIHAAAKRFMAHSGSTPSHFTLFESLEHLKSHSVFFLDEKELARIGEASADLCRAITAQNTKNRKIIEALSVFDPSLPVECLTLMTLNYSSRAFGNDGFVPLVECFNHSTQQGELIDSSGDAIVLRAKSHIEAGNQAYISYGLLDLFTHAVHYDYYDPADSHILRFDKRFYFPVLQRSDMALASSLPWRVNQEVIHGMPVYTVSDHEAYLSMDGPSPTVVDILGAIVNGRAHSSTNPKTELLTQLKRMLDANHVDSFARKYFPKSARRFHAVLRKEKELLARNIDWANRCL